MEFFIKFTPNSGDNDQNTMIILRGYIVKFLNLYTKNNDFYDNPTGVIHIFNQIYECRPENFLDYDDNEELYNFIAAFEQEVDNCVHDPKLIECLDKLKNIQNIIDGL